MIPRIFHRASLWLACLTVLVWSPLPLEAQLPPQWQGAPIASVSIAGEAGALVDPDVLGISPGTPASRALFRQVILTLIGSGVWRDAQFDLFPAAGGKVRVVAHLVPRVLLLRVDIVGNSVLLDDEIIRSLGLGEGSELFSDELPGHVGEVEAAYRERGFEQARIDPVVRDTDDPTRKLLLLRITEGAPTRVARVVFQGDRPPRDSQVVSTLALDRGDVLDRPGIQSRLRDAEARARQRGWLGTELGDPIYRRTDEGIDVVIPSRIGDRFEVQIRGNGPVPRSNVDAALQLGSERLTTGLLVSLRDRCIELFRKFGFHHVSVTVSVESVKKGEQRLVVAIDPGTPLRVETLSFPGAKHFTTSFLRDQVRSYLEEDLPGSSFLHPVDTETVDALGFGGQSRRGREVPRPHNANPDTIYFAPTYERAIEHIKELYEADGYLHASLGAPALSLRPNGTAIVNIPVEEGPQTLLQWLQLTGNQVVSTHDIIRAAGLERGRPYSRVALEQAKHRIVQLYQERGYLYVRVDGTERFSADRSRTEIQIEIVESMQVRVGEVIVQGNALTETSLILGRLSFGTGDLYRPSAARDSQDQLLSLGIFSGVSINPQDADLPAQVKPVVITVSERQPQYIDLGLGFSTGQGVRGHFEYGFRNAFGLGHEFIFRADAAFQVLFLGDPLLEERFLALSDADRLERTITGEWRIPHFFDRHLRTSVSGAINRDNERDFGIERYSVGARLGWTPFRSLSGTVATNFEQTSVDLFVAETLDEFLRMNRDPRLQRLLRVPDGSTTIVAAEGSLNLDLRDSPFTPTEGFLARTSLEYVVSLTTSASAAGEPFLSDFLKWSVTTSGYLPLGNDFVLATQVRYGRVFHLKETSKTYPNRAFYLGGVDTLRGYLQDALIPQDVADQVAADPNLGPSDVARAGDTFLLVRTEVRFPIFGIFRGGAFLDLGNLWADPSLMLDHFSLRPTVGLGIRLQTPVGPLAFDYGIILLRRRRDLNEPFGTFHFSIGLF